MNLSVSPEDRKEHWDWSENPLNFSESGWWGRIPRAMKVLIPILIGLLVVGCGMESIPQDPKEIKWMGDDNNSTAAKPVKEQ